MFLYNEKIDNIRKIEFDRELPPAPIKFAIYDAYSGQKGKQSLLIECKTVPKVLTVNLDLADSKLLYDT